MAIPGLITNEGIDKTIEAQNNEGFRLFPQSFGVSEQVGDFSVDRDITTVLSQWYTGAISAVVRVDRHTLQFSCNVPAGVASVPKFTREVYLYCKDQDNNDFLLGISQPSTELVYDPEGELRLRLQVKINNLDISNLYQFFYTQATEIEDHNDDPLAHPYLQTAMGKAGIHTQVVNRKWVGQTFDAFPVIGSTISDKVVSYFDILTNRYEGALADGSDKQYALGMYLAITDSIVSEGIIDYPHSLEPYRALYLSDSTVGQVTLAKTSIQIGFALPNNKIFLRINTSGSVEETLAQNPDGDVEINLNPALVRELTLVDELGGKWDVFVDDDGLLSTQSDSTREVDNEFKIQRVDESYAQIKVNSAGQLVVYSPPLNPNAIVDNAYYLRSPELVCYKFTVSMVPNIVMSAHENIFILRSGEFDMWAVRQSSIDKALMYLSTYDKEFLPDVPELISTLTPMAMVKELPSLPSKPVWFDGYGWRVIDAGPPVGSFDLSGLTEVQYQAIRGTGWHLADGRSAVGTLYASVTGLTVAPTKALSGFNVFVRVN